jgi:glutamate 5-kinase
MYSKLQSAHRAAQLAVPTIIVSGREPFALEKVFAGENLGTWIAPCQQAVSKRKFWMAYHADPAGSIRVDPGAARALTSGGKSLLPAGIVSVEGDFDHGDLVTIMDAAGRVLGVGLSNYSTADLGRIKGRQSSDIAAILGADLYPEVVHRDNMFLDPAL